MRWPPEALKLAMTAWGHASALEEHMKDEKARAQHNGLMRSLKKLNELFNVREATKK